MPKIAVRSTPRDSRRFTLTLAGLFALAALVAGCGGGDDSATTVAPGQSAQDRIRGFGLEATGSQTKQTEATLHGYMDARVAGEWNKACSYMANSVRQLFDRVGKKAKEAKESGEGSEVRSTGCARFVEESTRRLTPSERAALAKVKVTSVRVEDDQGYVLYREASGDEFSMSLKREGGEWKLVGIGGTALN